MIEKKFIIIKIYLFVKILDYDYNNQAALCSCQIKQNNTVFHSVIRPP